MQGAWRNVPVNGALWRKPQNKGQTEPEAELPAVLGLLFAFVSVGRKGGCLPKGRGVLRKEIARSKMRVDSMMLTLRLSNGGGVGGQLMNIHESVLEKANIYFSKRPISLIHIVSIKSLT